MLIITSLIVVMLLLSTVIYVNETEKNVPIYKPDGNASLSAIKQAAVHTLVSALANITNGGNSSVLPEDLAQFKAIAESRSYDAFSKLDYVARNEPPYTNGTLLSWGEGGQGVSSIDVAFTLNSSGIQGSYVSDYSVNLATSINIRGEVTDQNGSLLVTLFCTVLNEGNPASVQNLAVYYEQDAPGGWVRASPSIIIFGNGTYVASFVAQNATQTLLPVSVGCVDARGVTVWANALLDPATDTFSPILTGTTGEASSGLIPTNSPSFTPTPIQSLSPNLGIIPDGWGGYSYGNGIVYTSTLPPSPYQITAYDTSVYLTAGQGSARIDPYVSGSENTAREIDTNWLPVSSGDHIVFSCWIKTLTNSSTLYYPVCGGRIGIDFYSSHRLDAIQQEGPYVHITDSWALADAFWVKDANGGIWQQRTLDFIVPNTVYDCITGGQAEPTGIIAWMQAGPEAGNTQTSVWFADAQLYINP